MTDQTGSPVGASNGEFQTDRNGQITITGLTPGSTVTAVETETAEGFVLNSNPQSILIREGEVQRMPFFNSRKGSLHVFKIDSVSGASLSGAEFRITTAQGEPVDANEGRTSSNGIYTTDANGQVVLANLQPDSFCQEDM